MVTCLLWGETTVAWLVEGSEVAQFEVTAVSFVMGVQDQWSRCLTIL